jgi:hypothetical protein
MGDLIVAATLGLFGFVAIGRLTGWIKDDDYYPESAFRPSDLIFGQDGSMDPGIELLLLVAVFWLLAVVGIWF